ncbi:MAG: signal recognition particle-docking protein FtsY, partial [Pseudomonadota bacterium]
MSTQDKNQSADRKPGFFSQLKDGLEKTRRVLNTPIEDLFTTGRELDEEVLEDLEEALITADVGVQTTRHLLAGLTQRLGEGRPVTAREVRAALTAEIEEILKTARPVQPPPLRPPRVIMVAGVNGVGKTTTIGKLASRYRDQGKKVLLVAADTFRAAAVEQLTIWAERTGSDIVRTREGGDPASVVFDGMEAALARGVDVVLIDTAGRLHTKVNLMEELKKIKRSAAKRMPDAPHDTWLVIDATTGQNAVSQARMFDEAIGLTGLVLTKVDGTAKGGIVVGIASELAVPLLFLGMGEKVQDL